ncbi:AAA family ATPase [Thiothrix nivea]|uniref:AAA-ATPase-like protein n=1 Tax=Thiothrix nivea (strain ATCC 35100 / DSM 5205 / JP2) TaxID=870187 RepID=A0A656HLX4_THINJ|nr:AAA family ATPase [Thiothrix nivea]EIJ36299.1 AAA-ATPase-like protein [Thiothrix nivea DSM 5205]
MFPKIPYGESNFKTLMTEGYVYIDKTAYIPQLEEAGKYLFLLRPRRFGKSLFLSMLWHYYDVVYRNEFEVLFETLYIGQHPTPLRNSYQVLFMDFSGIDTNGGHDAVFQRVNAKVETYLHGFLGRYDYPDDYRQRIGQQPDPAAKMQQFFTLLDGQKVLLLIDEYDHFANSILADDLKLFQRIMGKGGFVRSFYEVLKTATLTGVLDRLFVTGVTPVMLDSMTSGFNIGQNLSLHEDFNEAIGFTEAEVVTLLQPLAEHCQLELAQLLDDTRLWYNGYRFNLRAENSVYNANMLLYFVKNFDRKRCEYPEPMLDENIASDYGKIMGMFSIGNRDENFAVLDELINAGEVQAAQRRKFEFDKGFDRDDFISLLAYMGFITLERKALAGEVFVIPNYAIREFYFHYFKVELERRNQFSIPNHELRLAVEQLALHANMQPLITQLERVMQLLSNHDALKMDEKHLKVILLTLIYQTQIYFIHSEREMGRHYPDILLLERNPLKIPYQHLIELKYCKKGDKPAGWEAKRQEGINQVHGYLQLPEVAALRDLAAWVLVTDGESVGVERVR